MAWNAEPPAKRGTADKGGLVMYQRYYQIYHVSWQPFLEKKRLFYINMYFVWGKIKGLVSLSIQSTPVSNNK